MTRKKLERTVRMAIAAAADQPMEKAVGIVADYLELILDSEEPVVTEAPRTLSDPAPAPPVDYNLLSDLAPIGKTTTDVSSKTRVYWDHQDLYNKIVSESAPYIEVTPEGRPTMRLSRSVAVIGDEGVHLAYMPQGADSATPYPKCSFWVTSEQIDIASETEKMRSQASEIYKVRTNKVRQPVAMDKPIRFEIGTQTDKV